MTGWQASGVLFGFAVVLVWIGLGVYFDHPDDRKTGKTFLWIALPLAAPLFIRLLVTAIMGEWV